MPVIMSKSSTVVDDDVATLERISMGTPADGGTKPVIMSKSSTVVDDDVGRLERISMGTPADGGIGKIDDTESVMLLSS